MKLKDHFKDKPRGYQKKMRLSIGVSSSFLSQIASGYCKAPVWVAKAIEKFTNGEVSREDLRPDIFCD